MAEVTEVALANRTKEVIFWGCCCHSVVPASDYVKQRLLKPFTLRITGSVSVHASDECVSVEHTASWYVLSFNARHNRWSVHILKSEPNVGETGASCYNFYSKSPFHKNMPAR